MNINHLTPILPHQLHAIFYMPYASLRQNIEFFETNSFGSVHIPLSGGQPFGRHIERGISKNRLFGYYHTAGMNGAHIRKILHHTSNFSYFSANGIIIGRDARLHKLINLTLGQPIHLAQFAYHRPPLKSIGSPQQCSMLATIFLKQILVNPVAFLPREIQVEIGRRSTFGIEESLEIEIQFNRVNISNTKAVGHHTIGTAATPHMINATTRSILHKIVSNKEIGRKTQRIYNVKLLSYPLARHGI